MRVKAGSVNRGITLPTNNRTLTQIDLPSHEWVNPLGVHKKRHRPKQIRPVGLRPMLRQPLDHLWSRMVETGFVYPTRSPHTRAAPHLEIPRSKRCSSHGGPP